MKQIKKKCIIIILLTLIPIFVFNPKVSASNIASLFETVQYSEEYTRWLELSNEEKKNVIMPQMYDVLNTNFESKNPVYLTRLLGAGVNNTYSLKNIIPSNLIIRNQKSTNSCWAFAALSSLETNLAMSNYKKGINTDAVYDYSERHMEYATSKTFANNVVNKSGYNRNVGDGGNWYLAQSYLTNGSGAIPENEMPFENNENLINISEILNKTISSQVYDTVDFANYQKTTDDDEKNEIMNQIKRHIKDYGAVFTNIHGNTSSTSLLSCYNNDTAAKYCNNTFFHRVDHAVSIIGWDDNYSVDNFADGPKPSSNGAWIIRNSWGEREEHNLAELKEEIFKAYESECIARGWTESSLIPDEFIEEAGFIIEGEITYMPIGDNGLMYVSYEDCNIARNLHGIIKAIDMVNYDNIYQYDDYYPYNSIKMKSSTIMLCTVFNKKTSGVEYLTEVSLYTPETYNCKVYVNPNGTSKNKDNLQKVSLKAGESEVFNAGYHTLEFSRPIELNGDSFVVVIEIEGERKNAVNFELETTTSDLSTFDEVTVESGKCFLAVGNNLSNCEWIDLGSLSEFNASLPNGDSTIKAFTTLELIDESLKNIEIVTPPNKTTYFEGEDFDKTGMVVKANYNSKINPSVILDSSSYDITNGTNLKVGQKSVTITFEDKSIEQKINVEKNSVTKLEIINPPIKTEYKEGKNFDATGMVIRATYKDGSSKIITDYTIKNGSNLKNGQTTVIISYEDKSIEQEITVIPNPLIKIDVTKAPNKTKYVVGQNFDKTGMIITGTYQDGETEEIKDYIVENGTNLTKDQTNVTIKYDTQITRQSITVEEKAVVTITIDSIPTKSTYIQNKEELELTGGKIKVIYNDDTIEYISMTSNEISITGFDNSKIGENKVTLTYNGISVSFTVNIIEEEKPKNSILKNAKCDINRVQAYFFTAVSDGYTLISIEINNILRNLDNDSVEYYYCLSANKDEAELEDWVKIKETQNYKEKLQFTIDSRQVGNYEEIAGENVIYIYIKEVATKGGNQSIAISNSMKFETDLQLETYIDNIKVDLEEKDKYQLNENVDNTTAPGSIPQAGARIAIAITIIIISGIGAFAYIRYKNILK